MRHERTRTRHERRRTRHERSRTPEGVVNARQLNGKALSYVDFVRTMHHALNADRPDAGDLPATRALTAQKWARSA